MTMATTETPTERGGLTGLDWFVILAAVATLGAAVAWLMQGGQLPGAGPAPVPVPTPTE